MVTKLDTPTQTRPPMSSQAIRRRFNALMRDNGYQLTRSFQYSDTCWYEKQMDNETISIKCSSCTNGYHYSIGFCSSGKQTFCISIGIWGFENFKRSLPLFEKTISRCLSMGVATMKTEDGRNHEQ